MEKREHEVTKLYAPKRIDSYLAGVWGNDLSRSEIKTALDDGRVLLNGMKVKPKALVKQGDRIEAAVTPVPKSPLKPEKRDIAVIYEDDSIIVVDKPVGMVVHPAPGNKQGTLVHALLGRGSDLSNLSGKERPGIVHRLDKETSGVLLVAKTNKAHRALQSQFAARSLSKTYTALVKGRVEYEAGHIQQPIGHHPKIRLQMAVVAPPRGREAETRYRVLKRFKYSTLLELKLITGRTHQIRVHMAHLGHPVLGDEVYGKKGNYPRMALHASKIELVHPKTGKIVEFESPIPAAMRQMIDEQEK